MEPINGIHDISKVKETQVKALGLVGSPRKQGNTDVLVSRILEGASSEGKQTEKLYLYDLRIESCLDCKACKQAKHECILKDDMQKVYPKLESADVIIFGTPLYWYGPTAKMKLLIDRLRPYILSKLLRAKKAVLVVPSQEGAQACTALIDMFRQSLSYLEMDLINQILVKAYDIGEVSNQPETLASAYQIGKSLSQAV